MTSSDRLARFLQQPTPRERAVRGLPAGADGPGRIGPAEFSTLGALVVVRCPRDLDPLMRRPAACGSRGRRWLIVRHRVVPRPRHGLAVPDGEDTR